MAETRWITTRAANDDVHVVPLEDGITHAYEGCPCGPDTEAVFRDDGSNGWLISHHSLDGREASE
jgi:hypothetical protein